MILSVVAWHASWTYSEVLAWHTRKLPNRNLHMHGLHRATFKEITRVRFDFLHKVVSMVFLHGYAILRVS